MSISLDNSLLTIILITDVNIIDKRWILLDDHLGNIIVYTSGIQETHVKDVFSHSGTLVDIPKNRSCSIAYSGRRNENKRQVIKQHKRGDISTCLMRVL